jgi:serine/threonine-protein kinase
VLVAVAAVVWAGRPRPASATGVPAADAIPAGVTVVVAGDGAVSSSRFATGAMATASAMAVAESVAALPDGGFLVTSGCAVWEVRGGVVARFAGDGRCAFNGDGGPATQASLENPDTVEATRDGAVLIGDGLRVRRVGFRRHHHHRRRQRQREVERRRRPRAASRPRERRDVVALPDDGFLVVDGDRVRRVDRAGVITTVAGTGDDGFSGDGGPATSARFSLYNGAGGAAGGLAVLPGGGFLVADQGNQRVREVDASGIVRTVAGTGRQGRDGDGGPATRARLEAPTSLLADADGSWLVGCRGVIRRVAPDGAITSVAGAARDGWTLTGVGT